MTSHYEGLGLVLLEALSAKTPIIATNTSAIPEIIENNQNGFLVEENDYNKLAELFSKVYDEDLTKIMENGRKFIEEKFSPEVMSLRVLKIYKDTLNS